MPGEKTQLEYYQYYCASQQRVEEWVQDTGPQCRSQQEGSSQWHGFLEDPCLATPISMSLPLEKGESRASGTDKEERDVPDHDRVVGHEPPAFARPDEGKPRSRHLSSTLQGKRRQVDHHDSSPSRARLPEPRKIRVEDIADNTTIAHRSSKHSKRSKESKDSKASKRTADSSKSQGKHSSASSRKRQLRKQHEANRPILAYVPYGVVPLLFAVTAGSSAVSFAAAAVILAGYLCVDITAEERSSRR